MNLFMQNEYKKTAPVLFLIFNRFNTTKQVFEAIRKVAPAKLYIASDGPRDNRAGEKEEVEKVRNYVLESVDWNCDIKTLFREKNLGCGKAVSEAITWFFENEEMGIILEDDCLPCPGFFNFCTYLLDLYRNDTRIFLISGHNKQGLWNSDCYDYFFSNLGGIWGWASWARAWKYYDYDISDIDDFISKNNFKYLFGDKIGKIRQKKIYSEIITKKRDTWDYQWGYARHKNNGLACVPAKNLVVNIGFGQDATHTKEETPQPDVYELKFPLKTNLFIVPDREYDKKFIGYGVSKQKRFINKITRFIKKYCER